MITPRDRALMMKLGECGILSTAQLANSQFKGVARTTVRRRLRALEKKRLIRRVRGSSDGGAAWVLTKATSERLGLCPPTQHFNRNTLEHDLTLSAIRLTLEQHHIGDEWIGEHALKRKQNGLSSDSTRIPDAMLILAASGKRRSVAIECELTLKSKSRYQSIFRSYGRNRELWGVLYFVESEVLGQKLETHWKEVSYLKPTAHFMWTTIHEVLRTPETALLKSEDVRVPLLKLSTPKGAAPSPALPQSTPSPVQRQTDRGAAL